MGVPRDQTFAPLCTPPCGSKGPGAASLSVSSAPGLRAFDPTSWTTTDGSWHHLSSSGPYERDVTALKRRLPRVLVSRLGLSQRRTLEGTGRNARMTSSSVPPSGHLLHYGGAAVELEDGVCRTFVHKFVSKRHGSGYPSPLKAEKEEEERDLRPKPVPNFPALQRRFQAEKEKKRAAAAAELQRPNTPLRPRLEELAKPRLEFEAPWEVFRKADVVSCKPVRKNHVPAVSEGYSERLNSSWSSPVLNRPPPPAAGGERTLDKSARLKLAKLTASSGGFGLAAGDGVAPGQVSKNAKKGASELLVEYALGGAGVDQDN